MHIPVCWFGSAHDSVTLKRIPSLKGVPYDITPIFDGDPHLKTHSEIFFHLWFDRPWAYDLK